MLKNSDIKEYDMNRLTEINWRIAAISRGKAAGIFIDSRFNFVITYLAYIALENDIEKVANLWSFLEKNKVERRSLFIKEIVKDNADIAVQLSRMYSAKDFLIYMIFFQRDNAGKVEGEFGTPVSLSKLALRILEINEIDRVADFGSGFGDFIVQAFMEKEHCALYGIEINSYSYEISQIRAELMADNIELELGDMFAIPRERKYDKIFSNYPFGMRLVHLQTGTDYIEELHRRIPDIKRATSSDWIFNSLVFDHLADSGKAVTIMTNGSTWNSIDQKIREYFVRNGFVEAVIALPPRLFEVTNIPTTMIVFSRNNKTIRMIDATTLCEQGRRQNVITEADIEQIIRLLKEDGKETITVDLKVLQRNDFVLNPSRYLEKTVAIEDGVEFGSLMKRITRGAQLKADELDELVSDNSTDTQYLMLANIQNGMISEDLPYLKELDPKLDKYCIGNRNLLLSKNGAPFKVAVAEVEEGKKILGNGNLFIIELNEEIVNPYFIKAFFDSEAGTAALKSIVVGATIPNISAESLKKLIVPLPSIEKQNEIADLYQAKQDEIKVLQLRIQKAQNELRGIFGEVE